MAPRPREPVGARFARERETSTDKFNRQWSLALIDNLETAPKFTYYFGNTSLDFNHIMKLITTIIDYR